MGKFRTAVSRARAAPDLPIPARLRYITCTKKTSRYPGAPTATATLTVTAIVGDSGSALVPLRHAVPSLRESPEPPPQRKIALYPPPAIPVVGINNLDRIN
ncbi:hypothetical protein D4764_13G0010980 [Takifugu flavidus]|uniref:Uncharacterized protein n=1 Tax=Takifugu flavidus TaxID=433684 RepID=A0A5C6PB41_9TELE|nr:hypothetical protein D4764_13G0010980 [Takifugu flavidus]